MGVSIGSQSQNGSLGAFKFLTRRKQVDSQHRNYTQPPLAKELTVPHLIALGHSFNSFLSLSFSSKCHL